MQRVNPETHLRSSNAAHRFIVSAEFHLQFSLRISPHQKVNANCDVDEDDDISCEREADGAPPDLLGVGQDDREAESGNDEEASQESRHF